MAQIRFTTQDVIKSSMAREAIWQWGFFRLIHAVEVLSAEGTIEPATAELLTQCAYDFKVCLEALDQLKEDSEQ